jgi:hypothetical protein
MLEYSLIILSTVLFGGQFIALNAYQGKNGKSYQSILFFCAVFSLTGALVFLSLNGFQLGFSWYTLLYAGIAAIIQIVLQIAGIKALALGRVEVYTLFNVAGGMSVAYLFGITYFQEEVKAAHIIGLVLVLLALFVPIIFDRKNNQKSRLIFWFLCAGVFLANGFFGSVNKIHIVSGEGLSIKEYMFYMYAWIAVLSSLSFLALSFFKKNETKLLLNRWGLLFRLPLWLGQQRWHVPSIFLCRQGPGFHPLPSLQWRDDGLRPHHRLHRLSQKADPAGHHSDRHRDPWHGALLDLRIRKRRRGKNRSPFLLSVEWMF